MTRASTLIVVGVALGVVVAAGGADHSGSSGGKVGVWGDSLTVNASSALTARGAQVHAKGGTAPCDWTDTFEQTLVSSRPKHVVFAFVGNSGSPCMVPTTSAAQLAARYRVALAAMTATAIRHQVPVTFVVPPYMGPNRAFYLAFYGSPDIGAMECGLAAANPRWVNCDTHARDMLSVGGHYAGSFGDTPVRTSDGIHLTDYGARFYALGILAAPTPPGAAKP